MVHANLNETSILRLHQAVSYWREKGYEYTGLPWIVPQKYTDFTKPPMVLSSDPTTEHGTLVASGEQSFLQLWDEGRLSAGKGYLGWSPCFRNEPYFDDRHHFYFMKAELFYPVPDNPRQVLNEQVNGALRFFSGLLGTSESLSTRQITADQIDIEFQGIELGSYGIRQLPDTGQYVYGTALAEPRFSLAKAASVPQPFQPINQKF